MQATLIALVAVMGAFVSVMGALGSYLSTVATTWSNWFSMPAFAVVIGGSWQVGLILEDAIAAWLMIFCGLLLFIAGQITGVVLRGTPVEQKSGTPKK